MRNPSVEFKNHERQYDRDLQLLEKKNQNEMRELDKLKQETRKSQFVDIKDPVCNYNSLRSRDPSDFRSNHADDAHV